MSATSAASATAAVSAPTSNVNDVDVTRVWLAESLQHMIVKCSDGVIRIPRTAFCHESSAFRLFFVDTVLGNGVLENISTFDSYSYVIVEVWSTSRNKAIGPPVAAGQKGRIYIGPSQIGAEHKGEFGTRLQGLVRTPSLDSDGFNGRFGLNVSQLPEDCYLRITFTGYSPSDGNYLLEVAYWRIIEEHTGGTIHTFGGSPPLSSVKRPAAAAAATTTEPAIRNQDLNAAVASSI